LGEPQHSTHTADAARTLHWSCHAVEVPRVCTCDAHRVHSPVRRRYSHILPGACQGLHSGFPAFHTELRDVVGLEEPPSAAPACLPLHMNRAAGDSILWHVLPALAVTNLLRSGRAPTGCSNGLLENGWWWQLTVESVLVIAGAVSAHDLAISVALQHPWEFFLRWPDVFSIAFAMEWLAILTFNTTSLTSSSGPRHAARRCIDRFIALRCAAHVNASLHAREAPRKIDCQSVMLHVRIDIRMPDAGGLCRADTIIFIEDEQQNRV